MLHGKHPRVSHVSVFITLFLFSSAQPAWVAAQSRCQAEKQVLRHRLDQILNRLPQMVAEEKVLKDLLRQINCLDQTGKDFHIPETAASDSTTATQAGASLKVSADDVVVISPDVNVANTPEVTVGGTPNVNVTNLATRPVLVSNIDDPGRIPYQAQLVDTTGTCAATECDLPLSPPMAGHRVVVEHISAFLIVNGAPSRIQLRLENPKGFLLGFEVPIDAASPSFRTLDQPVLAYLDASQQYIVRLNLLSPADGNGTFPNPGQANFPRVTLSGYELDCNAAPCAPIAH